MEAVAKTCTTLQKAHMYWFGDRQENTTHVTIGYKILGKNECNRQYDCVFFNIQ